MTCPESRSPAGSVPLPRTRRGFIRDVALASAATVGAAALAPASAPPAGQDRPTSSGDGRLPKGKIGNLEISRLIFGGNITSAWMHARDLSYVPLLARHYNTDQKILDTFALAESHGIDAIVGDAVAMLRHTQRYRDQRGGRMKVIGWFFYDSDEDRMRRAIASYAEQGASALLLNGCSAEDLLRIHGPKGANLIAKAAEIVRQAKVPFGVGAHALEVVQTCERHGGIAADFYLKTLHHHQYPTAPRPEQIKEPYAEVPGYWCRDPKAVIRAMEEVKKPWIAFKILAAGAIPPREAFRYAFRNGADFICVGMFDFQVEQNCRLAQEALRDGTRRKRPWCA